MSIKGPNGAVGADEHAKHNRSLTRRKFLRRGAVAGLGVAALYVAPSMSSVTARPAYASITGTVCIRPLECLDFDQDQDLNALANGTPIFNQWSAYGICISADNEGDGPDIAMIIDSEDEAKLTAANDRDLGTPNFAFGGPGVGDGGDGTPSAGTNDTGLGNLLIISEDGSSTTPDDEAGGGDLIFTFSTPVDIQSVQLVDIDTNEMSGIVCTTPAGLSPFAMLALGNNSVQIVDIDTNDVTKLEIKFPSSGAVANICFKQPLCVLPEADQPVCPSPAPD